MLYRDDYYSDTSEEEEDVEEKEIDKVEVIVAKNRHGPTNTVELGWNGEFTLFTSLEHHRDDDLF